LEAFSAAELTALRFLITRPAGVPHSATARV
jgi:hypothetical protein